ncbi:MAG TPA: response regulator transcription factor [Stenomitos sp.]
MKILLVEDDERTTDALAEILVDKQNYIVDIAADGEAGWQFLESSSYDLVVLDVMLPKLDGISLCQRLRREGVQTPVLMLTARDTSNDKVMGLDAGADDYVIKPFDLPELMARIRSLMRRGSTALPSVLEWEHLRVDPSNCRVTYAGKLLHLTPKEYGLLDLFLRNSHRILSRSFIIEHLWSYDNPPTEDTVKVHLKELRKKLKAVGAPELLEAVYGMGYRLKQQP